ncbi:hypothetical protein [Priestia megaterium]|nr:hypothetical protein [Priestia megaterium]UYP07193.1 hypothetical protein OIJ04_24110 [Priestia megaterium]
MGKKNQFILSDFTEENYFELDSYLTYLFKQINNHAENVSEA